MAIAIKIIVLAKAGERNPDLSCEGVVENFRERMQMSGQRNLWRAPRVALAEPSTLFTTMALIKEGSRSPALVPPRAGFSFSTRPFLGSKVVDRADSHPP